MNNFHPLYSHFCPYTLYSHFYPYTAFLIKFLFNLILNWKRFMDHNWHKVPQSRSYESWTLLCGKKIRFEEIFFVWNKKMQVIHNMSCFSLSTKNRILNGQHHVYHVLLRHTHPFLSWISACFKMIYEQIFSGQN